MHPLFETIDRMNQEQEQEQEQGGRWRRRRSWSRARRVRGRPWIIYGWGGAVPYGIAPPPPGDPVALPGEPPAPDEPPAAASSGDFEHGASGELEHGRRPDRRSGPDASRTGGSGRGRRPRSLQAVRALLRARKRRSARARVRAQRRGSPPRWPGRWLDGAPSRGAGAPYGQLRPDDDASPDAGTPAPYDRAPAPYYRATLPYYYVAPPAPIYAAAPTADSGPPPAAPADGAPPEAGPEPAGAPPADAAPAAPPAESELDDGGTRRDLLALLPTADGWKLRLSRGLVGRFAARPEWRTARWIRASPGETAFSAIARSLRRLAGTARLRSACPGAGCAGCAACGEGPAFVARIDDRTYHLVTRARPGRAPELIGLRVVAAHGAAR